MGRIMAIDYGQKRVGFAVTDELQICAHALETVPVAQAFDFLKDYLKKEKCRVCFAQANHYVSLQKADGYFIHKYCKAS